MTARLVILSVLFLTATSSDRPAVSQVLGVEKETLRGVSGIDIMISSGGPGVESCQIRTTDVELSAARPLLDAGLRVNRKESTSPTLSVGVVVMKAGIGGRDIGCVALLELRVFTFVSTRLTYQPSESKGVVATVLLWESTRVFTEPDSLGLNSRINSAIREEVDKFATKVRLANQK